MEIYISINGVLRNFIQKFDYHYRNYFLEIDEEVDEKNETKNFEYSVKDTVKNDNLLNYYAFQSKEEYENFCFIEFPLEIFGHAALSYSGVMTDLNKLMYSHKDSNFTLIGLDELAKAKPSTLFFLSKNNFLGNNIKFIKSEDIDKEWKKCDLWITDNEEIIDKCPKKKMAVKFSTFYNQHFYHYIEINNLTKIEELCLISSEKITTSMLMNSLKNVVQIMGQKILMKRKPQTLAKTENKY